jgi:hypothetical protein
VGCIGAIGLAFAEAKNDTGDLPDTGKISLMQFDIREQEQCHFVTIHVNIGGSFFRQGNEFIGTWIPQVGI